MMSATTAIAGPAAPDRKIKTEDARIVVARPVRADLIEIRGVGVGVGVEPTVLEAHGLDGVDVPDISPQHSPVGHCRGEDMIERTDHAVKGIRLLACLRNLVDIAACCDRKDRILQLVSVEIADEHHRLGLRHRLLPVGERDHSLGLPSAIPVVAPCPASTLSPVAAPPLFDLKWFAITSTVEPFEARIGSKARARGSRALSKASEPMRMVDSPTGSTVAAR